MATKKKNVNNNIYGEVPTNIKDHPFYGMVLDDQQVDFVNAILNKDNLVVFCNAKAGTGKTTLAVGAANILVQHGLYDGIVYVVAPTQEEKSGYLPGTADQKTQAYVGPLYDALVKLGLNPFTSINQESISNQKNGTGFIDCVSHLWLRGCNLDNKIVIIDESQNFYKDELKKVLTRILDTSKTICIGHTGQCDLYHNPERSGFAPYIEHFKDEPYAHICELAINHRGVVSTKADELE